jgi:hypothetical protein
MITATTTDLPAHVAFEVRTEKFVVKAVRRTRTDSPAEYRKSSRVFGALDTLVPELMALEPFVGIAIPLASPERSAEDNVRSAMWNAWKRESIKVGAARLMELLTEAFASSIGGEPLLVPPTEIRFSQKAGCTMCPCSPGFVLDVRYTFDYSPIDLWIEPARTEA